MWIPKTIPAPAAARNDGDKLCLRMQRIRNRMNVKVDGLRQDAQTLLDWRAYVGQFPWLSTIAAAAIGFWIFPVKPGTPVVQLNEQSLDDLIKKGGLHVAPPQRPVESWLQPLRKMVTNLAFDILLGYAAQLLLPPRPGPDVPPQERQP